MSTRSILGFIFTMEGLRNSGVDVDKRLKSLGIDLATLSPDGEIERAHELRLINAVVSDIADPMAGLKAGAIHSIAGYGPFTMLLVTCLNPWDAFQTGVRYQSLTYLFGTLSLIPGDQISALSIKPVPLPSGCKRFIIDRDLAGTYQLIRDLQANLGLDIQPQKIVFPYPKPKEYRVYEQHFGCPIQFDSNEGMIQFKNEAALKPFPSANRTAHLLYRNQCDQLLLKRETRVSRLAEQVAAHLDLFIEQFPAAEDVARTFGLSERSFRRKLSTESTSFRKLLDDVRFSKALHLLKDTTHSIETVAQMLGYAESASFNHAFQRWTEHAPGVYRSMSPDKE